MLSKSGQQNLVVSYSDAFTKPTGKVKVEEIGSIYDSGTWKKKAEGRLGVGEEDKVGVAKVIKENAPKQYWELNAFS